MGNSYSHLNLEKRRMISELIKNGKTPKEISTILSLHISTVYREIERGTNSLTGQYDANYSENTYKNSLGNKGKVPFFEENKEMAVSISHFILNEGLSPEQAIVKLKQQGYSTVPSKTTVYAAIERGLIPGVSKESLNSRITNVFSSGMLHLPKWVCEKLGIIDGNQLFITLEEDKIVLKKV